MAEDPDIAEDSTPKLRMMPCPISCSEISTGPVTIDIESITMLTTVSVESAAKRLYFD